MPDYKNGKIYCIRSYQTDDVYIGSTTQKLCRRMTDHRKNYKGWVKGKRQYTTSYEIIKLGDAYVDLLELCPCSCKEELHKIEGEYIRKMKCVNKCIPGRGMTSKEYDKEYREKNKENIAKRKKEHRAKNKERINKNAREYRKNNKDKINEKSRAYYEKNKAKINKQRKERYAKKKLEKMLSTGQ